MKLSGGGMGSSTEHPVPAVHLAISKQRDEARVSYGDNNKELRFLTQVQIIIKQSLLNNPLSCLFHLNGKTIRFFFFEIVNGGYL
ncbi:MAG: hypothetical protein EZS28_032759 [Streblomastix strix]|uniref:Uncharacterized protein n=1 Tax=Streblomastix strix TaxID=222440 RepID=A0A5J4UNK2_9EUKA|nr:MAG: hypothetical protein EZS28_032759 [Streblomastix strix]